MSSGLDAKCGMDEAFDVVQHQFLDAMLLSLNCRDLSASSLYLRLVQ
jgi:hypothetical protein